jgi:tetrahydromethanopterin S-methyltransferase subunit C
MSAGDTFSVSITGLDTGVPSPFNLSDGSKIFFDNVNLALAPTVPTLTAPFALVLVAAILGIGTAASIRLRGRSL